MPFAACKLLAVGVFLIAATVRAEVVDIADIQCDAKANSFAVRYVVEKDDLGSNPKLPASCRLTGSTFTVAGARGPFSVSGQCGAQPPVSIRVSHNSKPLVGEVTFGVNCFGGPSLASLSVTKTQRNIQSIDVCVFLEPSLLDIEPEQKPYCVTYQGSEIRLPITQAVIDEISRSAKSKR